MIPVERINFLIEKLKAESERCAKQYSDKWNMDRDYHGAFGDGIDRALTLLESVVREYEPSGSEAKA